MKVETRLVVEYGEWLSYYEETYAEYPPGGDILCRITGQSVPVAGLQETIDAAKNRYDRYFYRHNRKGEIRDEVEMSQSQLLEVLEGL